MKKILMYSSNEQNISVVREIMQQEKTDFILIGDEQLKLTVQLAFLLDKDQTGDHRKMSGEYLLMDGITKEEWYILFENIKRRIKDFDVISIIRTSHNQHWNLLEVFRKATQEKELMAMVMELESILSRANQLDLNSLEKSQREEIKHALMSSYLLLSQGKFEKEQVKEHLILLKEILKGK